MKAQLPYHYKNYIFDLYGTLVDIHTDENAPALWEKMCLFYGYYGANYSPEELHSAWDSLTELYRREAKKHTPSVFSKEEQSSGNTASSWLPPASDKTRAETESTDAAHIQQSRADQDYEASPEIDLSCVVKTLYHQKGITPSPDLVVHTGQFFRVLSTEYIRMYDGTVEMLEHLRTAGKKIWLLSNAQRIFTQYELRLLGLDQRFDGILISSDYGVGKPDPFFFHQLTEQFGLDFKKSLFIGNDAVNDIGGARRAGLDSFYVHSNLSFVTPDWIHASASASNSPSGAFSGAFSDVSSKASLNASPHEKAPSKNASSPLMHFQLGGTINYTLMDFTGWTI